MSDKDNENRRNFDTIHKHLLRHLSGNDDITNLSKQFGALDSNLKRVDFVIELLNTAKIEIDFQSDGKNDEIAAKLREEGNKMFKIKKLKEAWEFYTKSICHAEENTVNLGLAYANRSAVLFELNLHEQCLMDIKRALQHNYPDNLRTKLFVREKNAKNSENEAFTDPHEVVPTILEKNLKIQCASNCLEIREDKDFGRYIAASRDIKLGEILAVERPFVLLLVDQYLCHCHECIKLCYNLIPCKGCTLSLYCSDDCRERAFEKYHRCECPILATIRSLDLDKLKVIALRIAILVKNQYSEIESFVNNLGEVYQSDRYREIHNLVANTSRRSVPDLFRRATVAAVIFKLVKNRTDFFDGDMNLENVFKEILLLHLQTGPSNFHEITELVPRQSGTYEPEEIASGAFSFLSLLNHSCSPNVTRFCYGSTIVLRAIQNIKKGEQCFDNYGYHHALMTKSNRQKQLQSQYCFDCVCEACENNWSLYNDLPSVDIIEDEENFISQLCTGDVTTAEAVLKECLPKLGELQKVQPCKNFCQIQEIVKQCFAIFGNKRRIF